MGRGPSRDSAAVFTVAGGPRQRTLKSAPHPLSEESKLEKIKSFKFMEIRTSLSYTDVGRDRKRLVFMVGKTASKPLIRAELCKTFVK